MALTHLSNIDLAAGLRARRVVQGSGTTVVSASPTTGLKVLDADAARVWVLVRADSGNTGVIYVGDDPSVSGDLSNSIVALAADEWVRLPLSGALWVARDSGTQAFFLTEGRMD